MFVYLKDATNMPKPQSISVYDHYRIVNEPLMLIVFDYIGWVVALAFPIDVMIISTSHKSWKPDMRMRALSKRSFANFVKTIE